MDALNTYLKRFANQDIKRGLTRVYVLCDGRRIAGYFSLSAHSVSRQNLPPTIQAGPYEELPFLMLGRLAVDREYQGRGLGDVLIVHAFAITRSAAGQIGILGMIVDAKDEHAAGFYQRFGFQRLSSAALRLVLPITTMDRLLG
ncbi:GNAT family N-acetyltransferase [Rhizobium sp. R339]|uniref:GNAT family N-acetyltransferase n=1 Tax=Rhizobium sp. R339 TaxID=1764273 RepID=UPI001FD9FE0F|nr:GNAT family N-acetyltransferase [Rhizobium sp. R339]